mgnify:CR=1 FL=1
MKKKKITAVVCAVLALAVVSGSLIYNSNITLDIDKFTVSSPDIPKEFDSYNIVQLSDIHNVDYKKFKEDFFESVKSCDPDVIFITGDIVSSYPPSCENSIEIISRLTGISDVYFVSGNHEAWEDEQYGKMREAFKRYGVRELENESVFLEKDGGKINLIGIIDPELFGGMDKRRALIERTMTKLVRDDMYNIMLFHRPEYFDEICRSGVQLAFTGHAHGGQFILPFIGGVIAPGQGLFPEYTEGIYTSDKTQMVVSRGIGQSMLPFRINNSPEIVLVTLKSEKN